MSRKPIYSYTSIVNLAAGANYNRIFQINANNRQLKIESLYFDIQIRQAIGNKLVSFQNNQDIQPILTMGAGAGGPQISSTFEFTGTLPAVNGTGLLFCTPGQFFFNNFFVTNNLPFEMQLVNNGAIAYSMIYSIAVEIEELIIWNSPPVESYRTEE